MTAPVPGPGDEVIVSRQASPAHGRPFVRPFRLRVIQVTDAGEGHVWLHGYQLAADGKAVQRRTVLVNVVGLRWPD